jgi:hypothetical protein
MKKMRSYLALLACLLIGSPLLVVAQSNDYNNRYKNAKALLNEGNDKLAMESFKQLSVEDPTNSKVPYANFYYAVAAFNSGYIPLAKDLFLQIEKKYGDFPGINEVYLWEAKIGFETSGLFQGMYYATKVAGAKQLKAQNQEQKLFYLNKGDVTQLTGLLGSYPDDKDIAQMLAEKINQQPFESKDLQLLDSLVSTYDLDASSFSTQIQEDVYKETYNVGVLLPLFVERSAASGRYLKKSLAIDLYEGIEMAHDDLFSDKINLLVFDTKRNADTISSLLNNPTMSTMDALIGPLYPQPVRIASGFAYDHAINMINPVSTNSMLTQNNPYSFLSRTGSITLGEEIADYVSQQMINKNAIIYYGTSTSDSLLAYSYKQRIESDSFKVVILKQITKDNPRSIFDELTAAKDVVDSVALQKMWNEGQKVRYLPKMDSLLIRPDSIGHIFVASDNSVMAAEVMSAVTSRGDSTQIIGYGDWYNQSNAGLDLLEHMNIWLAFSEADDINSTENAAIAEKYFSKFHEKPSKYFFMGYHAMQFLASSLIEYGVFFQNGYNKQGSFNPHWQYQNSQDNQAFKIVQLKFGRVVQLNFQQNTKSE